MDSYKQEKNFVIHRQHKILGHLYMLDGCQNKVIDPELALNTVCLLTTGNFVHLHTVNVKTPVWLVS